MKKLTDTCAQHMSNWNQDKENFGQKLHKQEFDHVEHVKRINQENFTLTTKLNADMEALRLAKDAEIARLHAEAAKNQGNDSGIINEKDAIIKALTQKILMHEAVILQLQSSLERK